MGSPSSKMPCGKRLGPVQDPTHIGPTCGFWSKLDIDLLVTYYKDPQNYRVEGTLLELGSA
jgi:hypothetical protein